MEKRFHGAIFKWNGDRGFGFIRPDGVDAQVFVHVSDFKKGEKNPRIGERVFFEMGMDASGRKKAIKVQFMDRPQLKQTTYSRQREQKHHHYSEAESFSFLSGLLRAVLSIALIVGATVFAYGKFKEYQNRQQLARQAPSLMDAASTQTADTRFRCDGRQHCSQMTSCEEAKFFMNNCPGTKMDGDGDGIPCEEQWCAGFLR